MATYKKRKPLNLKGKSYKPTVGPYYVDSRVLQHVYNQECYYDDTCRPVCPNCGVYNFRPVQTTVVNNPRGRYLQTGVCLTKGCNTVYSYHRNGVK